MIVKSTIVDIDSLDGVESVAGYRYNTLSELDRFGLPSIRRNMVKVTREIALQCDHCYTIDGRGFSKVDAFLGHEIAVGGIPKSWSNDRVADWAYRLTKYSRQLGYDVMGKIFDCEEGGGL